MFIIYGRKTANIHKSDHSQPCWSCKDFDLNVLIQITYFHFFFIPLMPTDKDVYIRCGQCGEHQDEPDLKKAYKKNTRAPFYLYTILILIGLFIGYAVIANINKQNEKAKFIAQPMTGDVYLIRSSKESKPIYYFLRVNTVSKDTVYLLHNVMAYYQTVSSFVPEDYFMKEVELAYPRNGLEQMLENGEINSIQRNYSISSGFDRLQ